MPAGDEAGPGSTDPLADPYRLRVVDDLALSGQDGDIHLDAILRTLAAACDVSIAALNIVTPGRQVFAAELGFGLACGALPDELNFCAAVVSAGRRVVISNAVGDEVLRCNPFVVDGMIGAYAGEPVFHRGVVVGALAIFAGGPREFTEANLAVLHEQTGLVELILSMRYDADHTNAVLLRSLVDHSQSLIHVKDLRGRYLLANPPMAQALGRTENELLGCTDDDLDPDLAPARRAVDRRARDGSYSLEEFLDLPDGRHVYESVKYPLTDAGGKVYATGGVAFDVTAKRRVAEAVAAARDAALEASHQKSTFLATMSHEIRTPMNAVIGMTGLLLETTLDAEQQEFVETVRSSGEALLSIINDILDFSKIEAGGLRLDHRAFDLRGCVDGCAELVAATPGAEDLELVVHVDPRCPAAVVGDAIRLGQVLVNLLRNAVKFTPAGEVLLTIEPVDGTGQAAAEQDPATVHLRFSVADTGIGIPADRLASVFESFSQVDTSSTRNYGGTGLGLAISRRLVAAMGGELTVDSVEGSGSTFGFTLAFGAVPSDAGATAPSVGSAGAGSGARAALDGRSVLLVDDHRTSRRVLRLLLESWGITVTEAAGGSAALALLAQGTRFDVGVIDMAMPGMTGPEVARRMRGAAGSPPLICLGGATGPSSGEPVDLFAAVVPKPVRGARLADGLLAALGAPRPVPEPRPAIATAAPGSGLRVLLAEDNTVNQRLGRLMLARLGHHVDVVGNGRDAADAVSRTMYDAVLMDVEMPVLDGIEATRIIRADLAGRRGPQIVALTASARAEDRDACLAAGMDDHLAKPVRLADLEAVLNGVTARLAPPSAAGSVLGGQGPGLDDGVGQQTVGGRTQ